MVDSVDSYGELEPVTQLERIKRAAVDLRTGVRGPLLGYGYDGNPMPIFDMYVGAYVVEQIVHFLEQGLREPRIIASGAQKHRRLCQWADRALDVFFEGRTGHDLVRAETERRAKRYEKMRGKNHRPEEVAAMRRKAREDAQGQLLRQAQRYRDRLVRDASQQLWQAAEERLRHSRIISLV